MVIALATKQVRAEIQLPGASLTVKNPPSMAGCVEEGTLGAKIESQISRRSAAASTSSELRLDVEIHRTLTTLEAHLKTSGKTSGTRRIEAARCEGLTDALAVTIAMILDQDARANHTAAATSAVPVAASQAEAPVVTREAAPVLAETQSTPPATSTVAEPASSSPQAKNNAGAQGFRLGADHELRAWLGGGYGSSPSFLVEAGGGYAYRRWALTVGGFYQPKHDVTLGPGTLELTSMGGSVAGCRRFGDQWRFVPCGRLALGAQSIQPMGYDRASSQRLLVGSVGPAFGIETGHRWVFGLELIAQLSLWRDEYLVDNAPESAKAPLFVAWLVARVALSSGAEPAAKR